MRIECIAECGEYEKIGPVVLPLSVGDEIEEFEAWYFGFPKARYAVWVKGDLKDSQRCLLRLQSACIWGNLFGSCYCDCRWQLEESKRLISQQGCGLIVYAFDDHGKGVGVRNHFLIYAEGQRQGFELVVDAYEQLGFQEDYRNYDDIVKILGDVGVDRLGLLTNSPRKIDALQRAGLDVERVPLIAPTNTHNRQELAVKASKLGHLLNGS